MYRKTLALITLACAQPAGAAVDPGRIAKASPDRIALYTADTPAPSFDCAAASSTVETLICSDAELAALDTRLADRFAAAVTAAEGLDAGADEAVATLRAYQRGWISGRDDCWKSDDLRACVKAEYLRREGQLVAEWMLEQPVRMQDYTCGDNAANVVSVFYFDTALPAIRLEYGDGIDVGSLGPAGAGHYNASFGRSFTDGDDTASLVWTEGEPQDCVPAD